MPRFIYHRDRNISLERDISWSRGHYAPMRLPAKVNTKAGKDDRKRPPGKKKP